MPDLRRTPLYDRHLAAGARMVPFGDWEMPVQYASASAEHACVRTRVGMFDVSHMGEVWVRGPGACALADRLVTNHVGSLADGKACYAGMLNEQGGFIDDLIVYRFAAEEIFICLNAGNAAEDIAWIRRHAGDDVTIDDACADYAQIAVQGPEAVALVDGLFAEELVGLVPFAMCRAEFGGERVIAARTGYTGEDGFELYVPSAVAGALWDALAAAGAEPCGLAARDSLRLEMKFALYGNDIDTTTNPLEAGLGWICKDREKDFIGAAAVRAMRVDKPQRRLVGLLLEGRRIARGGTPVVAEDGREIGRVTSGVFSPTLQKSIALAYVPRAQAPVGTSITVSIRGREHAATVVKPPFVTKT
jgi:aminomethyltransferase